MPKDWGKGSMTKKVCRVFWSYDVQKTEKWLADMAKKGYILVSVDFNLRLFKFEIKIERELIYRIVYSEGGNSEIPKGLAQNGWGKVVESKFWSILINEKTFKSIESFPSRQRIIAKNEKVKYITGILFSITLMLNIILIGGIIKYVTDITVAEKTLLLVKITFINRFTILGSISLYIYLKIRSSNKKLNIENNLLSGNDTSLEKEEVYDKRIEKNLNQGKKL